MTVAPLNTLGNLTPSQQTADATATAEQRHAAQQFEAMFLRQLLGNLGKSGGLGGSGAGAEVYGSMMVGALADTASEGGGIGLAEIVLKAMLPVGGSGAAKPAPAPHVAAPSNAGSRKTVL
jgi:flagellar protein FlgJ